MFSDHKNHLLSRNVDIKFVMAKKRFFFLLHSSWEHRASTRLFHRIRFCAVLFAPSHVMLAFANSFSIDLLQVCLGRPRPLLPCGFHSSAIREMLSGGFLSVWPIHRHFLRLICSSMGSSFVKFNSAALLMVFGQNILQMMRRHLFTKV